MLNNEYYALKEIPRHKLYTNNKIYSHLTEPNILQKLNHYDFLPKLISTFHDYDNIYLITSYYEGKSLDFFSFLERIFYQKNKLNLFQHVQYKH